MHPLRISALLILLSLAFTSHAQDDQQFSGFEIALGATLPAYTPNTGHRALPGHTLQVRYNGAPGSQGRSAFFVAADYDAYHADLDIDFAYSRGGLHYLHYMGGTIGYRQYTSTSKRWFAEGGPMAHVLVHDATNVSYERTSLKGTEVLAGPPSFNVGGRAGLGSTFQLCKKFQSVVKVDYTHLLGRTEGDDHAMRYLRLTVGLQL